MHLSRNNIIIGCAVAIIAATWLTLVVWQPQDSQWNQLADSRSSTIALVGFCVPALMLLSVTLPKLPVRTLALMPVALALNIILGQVVGTMGLPLPLYIDSLGTVLVGALAGPAAGVTTGVLSALIWGTFNPHRRSFCCRLCFRGLCSRIFGQELD